MPEEKDKNKGGNFVKVFINLLNTLLFMLGVVFVSFVVTFFLFIFMPENVQQAIEYFLQLFNFSCQKPLTNAFFGCII